MHHKYNTEAFILKSLQRKDADKIYFLFTEDFGLIRAGATGVRFLKSKLRYHLSDFNCLSVSLVRGREYWRIVGAEHSINFINDPVRANELEASSTSNGTRKINQEIINFSGKIFSLVLRLVHGEEKNKELFLAIKGSLKNVREKGITPGLECLSVARIMRSLGYLKTKGFEGLFENHDYDENVIMLAESMRKEIIKEVNKSLDETHL
ncbi:MAG: recombination protein O N-terminal domain-containing protein [Minisyncoccia bacterium]